MNSEKFNEIISAQLEHCKIVLCKKAKEYATKDRLHNFKVAASLERTTPVAALMGMMAKHTVSVYDMCIGTDGYEHLNYPLELWDEKITDSINYLLLLRALVEEENSQ